jgi:SAM-dependent methyltransferase
MASHSDERYLHGHHSSVLRSHTWRTVDNSAGYLRPYLKPGVSVLDVGSGPGTITVDMARLVAPGDVLGIDTSDQVVADAAGLAADNGLANVSFRVADAYRLDLPDDAFDVVHAHQVLQHLADPVAALREMRRVLKPGGILAVRDVDYGATTWYPRLPGLDAWLATYEAAARASGGEPFAGRHLKAWVRAAGFAVERCSASAWCFASAAEREWWGGSWAERSTESGFAASAIEGGHATVSDLRSIAAAWLEWSASEDGWISLTHAEVLARKNASAESV